jgi:hypothetical protein
MKTTSKNNLILLTIILFILIALFSLTTITASSEASKKNNRACNIVKADFNKARTSAVITTYALRTENKKLAIAESKARINTNNYLRIKGRYEDQIRKVITIEKGIFPVNKKEALQKEKRKLNRLEASFKRAYAISLKTGNYRDNVEKTRNYLRSRLFSAEKRMTVIAKYAKTKGCKV